MKILITGATGLVGSKLCNSLCAQNHELIILTRDPRRAKSKLGINATFYEWQPETSEPPQSALSNLDVVVHLAGESIAQKRWCKNQKQKIRDSRILSTRNLVGAISKSSRDTPIVFISASAVGFYGDTGNNIVTETSAGGDDFLARVCKEWEASALKLNLSLPESRVVLLRSGLVLSAKGGMLARLNKIFNWGAGGVLGNGKQWMSWIHIDDLISLILFIMKTSAIQGPINATSPHPVSHRAFIHALAKALKRPAFFVIPSFIVRFLFGEMADLFLMSSRVKPEKALTYGFSYRFEDIDRAFTDLL